MWALKVQEASLVSSVDSYVNERILFNISQTELCSDNEFF